MSIHKRNYQLSASLICADMLHIEDEIKRLEKGGIDQLHFDVMDGLFVPRIGLFPELLKQITSITKIPVEIHLMIESPEKYIENFIDSGASAITIHAESTQHLHRAIKQVKDKNIRVGVALNPATSFSVLDYIQDELDYVMLMAINPGIVGHKLIPSMIKKISDLRNMYLKNKETQIYIDGGVNFESIIEMISAGADVFVCGTQTIFRPNESLDKKIQELKEHIDTSLITHGI